MGFFVGWELWEKMCFVLACLIAIVLAYGTGVHFYNNWRIKKLRAADLQKKSQQDEMAESGEAKGDDIPFGSRAIESGIEVEGIWISNHNTPVPSPRPSGTPIGTPQGTRPSTPKPERQSQKKTGLAHDQQSRQPSDSSSRNADGSHTSAAHQYALEGGYAPSRRGDVSDGEGGREERMMSQPHPQPRHRKPGAAADPIEQNFGAPMRDVSGQRPDLDTALLSVRPVSMYTSNRRYEQTNQLFRDGADSGPSGLHALHNHRQYHIAETGQLGSSRNSIVGNDDR